MTIRNDGRSRSVGSASIPQGDGEVGDKAAPKTQIDGAIEKQANVGGTADGSAGSAQRVADQAGIKKAGTSSPLFVRGDGQIQPKVLVLDLVGDNRSFSTEFNDALQAFSEKHGDDAQALGTSEIGSSLFSRQVIFQVAPKLLPQLEALVAEHAEVEATALDALTQLAPTGAAFSDKLTDQLKGGLVNATQAMLDIGALLKADPSAVTGDRQQLARDLFNVLPALTQLFNGVLIETTRQRRAELLAEQPNADVDQHGGSCGCSVCDAISSTMNRYLGSSSQAKSELRALGGTQELEGLRQLILRSGEALEALDTPYAAMLLTKLIPQGDGVVLSALAARPQTASKLVELLTNTTLSRMDQTIELMPQTVDGRPDGIDGTMHSGGLDYLGQRFSAESLYRRSEDSPSTQLDTEALLFLGTEQAPLVRKAVENVILRAEQALPELQRVHREVHMAQGLKSLSGIIEHQLRPMLAAQDLTDAQRAEQEAGFVQRESDSIAKRYDDRGLTGQTDVVNLVRSLAFVGLSNDHVFSQTRSLTEIATLVSDVIPQLQTGETHEMLADVGLAILSRAEQLDETPDSLSSVISKLQDVLLTEGPSAASKELAATNLAPVGVVAALPLMVEALGSDSHDVLREALTSIAAIAIGLIDPMKVREPSRSAVQNNGDVMRSTMQSALPGLAKVLAEDPVVWNQVLAAKAIVRIAPEQADDAIQAMTQLFSPEPVAVEFSPGNHGTKNIAVRKNAGEVLKEAGAAAESARPVVNAVADAGKKADALIERIEARRQATDSSDTYFAIYDPEVAGDLKAMLQELEPTHGGSVARLLNFMNDPNATDLREKKSYELSDYPSDVGTLDELSQAGQIAQQIKANIDA